MTCHNCQNAAKKHGKDRKGHQRYRCEACNKTFIEFYERPLDEMRIPSDRAIFALNCLVEGCSIRTTERLTGLHRDTIMALLVKAGERCAMLLESKIQALPVKRVEADELWAYVGKKEKRKKSNEGDKIGDAYTFVGIEAETKLVLCFELGRRDFATTIKFVNRLKKATSGRFQLTTDGFIPYVGAVEDAFGADIDFSQLIKVYATPTGDVKAEARYSPPAVINAIPKPITGNPDPDHISTSFIERQNLTMRMMMRRLTRLTNAFSKKWENLKAALALHFAFYNFCRVHRTLRCTPAMEAGIASHVWTLAELIGATH